MRERIIITGFGGQGVLLIGRLLAEAGIRAGYRTTWYPFYEGQIRGAMVNCYVTIASSPIGLPVVYDPPSVIVMSDHELATLESLEASLVAGGCLIVNSSIVRKEPGRQDLTVVKVPANRLAEDLGSVRVANLIALGAYLRARPVVDIAVVREILERRASGKQQKLTALNRDALRTGYDFASSGDTAAAGVGR